jgi:hypothetical protein
LTAAARDLAFCARLPVCNLFPPIPLDDAAFGRAVSRARVNHSAGTRLSEAEQ